MAPIALLLGFGVVLVLSNRPVQTPEGLPVISDMSSYNQAIQQAVALTQKHFIAYDEGDTLTDADKADVRKGALLFDTANKLEPDRAGFYLDAGRAYLILGEVEEAEQRLMQCLSNAQLPNSDLKAEGVADAYFLLSQVRAMQLDFKGSLQFVTAADKKRPRVATYLTAKASAELQLKMMAEAKKDLGLALSIDPTYKRALALKRMIELASKP